jgi:hypothetical protein
MKRLMTLCGFALTMSVATLHAQQTPAACSNATLDGTYGINLSGTWAAPSVLPDSVFVPGHIEQMIGVVIQTFDGKGSFTQTNNIKGEVSGIIANYPASGTYTINANCTGTFTLTDNEWPVPIITQIVIVNSGAQIRGVVVAPQLMMVVVNGIKL